MVKHPCQFTECGRSAYIMDTRIGKIVCDRHRFWLCEACGTEHRHDELSRYSDDEGYTLTCRRTGRILLMEFWPPVASWQDGTAFEDLCGRCWGKGRCQCVNDEIGEHERCLRCGGDKRCTRCDGSGLRPRRR